MKNFLVYNMGSNVNFMNADVYTHTYLVDAFIFGGYVNVLWRAYTSKNVCVSTDIDFACTYPGPRQMAVDRNRCKLAPTLLMNG